MKPLLNLKDCKVMTPFQGAGSLEYRISSSDIFIMYGSKNYLRGLRRDDELIKQQISIIKRIQKPVVVLMDTNMSIDERIEFKYRISRLGINIIREFEYDFRDEKQKEKVERQLDEIGQEFKDNEMYPFRWQ